jgi:hypothetical protein
MRIYLAAKLERHADVRALARRLERDGHAITSRWHNTIGSATQCAAAAGDRVARRRVADANYRDLGAADGILALLTADCRGTLMELATAYALGLRVVVVGARAAWNLMLERPDVAWCPDEDAAVALLGRAP